MFFGRNLVPLAQGHGTTVGGLAGLHAGKSCKHWLCKMNVRSNWQAKGNDINARYMLIMCLVSDWGRVTVNQNCLSEEFVACCMMFLAQTKSGASLVGRGGRCTVGRALARSLSLLVRRQWWEPRVRRSRWASSSTGPTPSSRPRPRMGMGEGRRTTICLGDLGRRGFCGSSSCVCVAHIVCVKSDVRAGGSRCLVSLAGRMFDRSCSSVRLDILFPRVRPSSPFDACLCC